MSSKSTEVTTLPLRKLRLAERRLREAQIQEARDFEVFSVFSTGCDLAEAASRLGTTRAAASRAAATAFSRLTRESRFPHDVIESVFYPRMSGKPPTDEQGGLYSAPTVSVECALRLHEWEQAAAEIDFAQLEMQERGLRELQSILTGERQPEDLFPPRFVAFGWDVDLVLWSDSNGMHLDDWIDVTLASVDVVPATLRLEKVFEVQGVVGHERIIIRSYDQDCEDFLCQRKRLASRSAKPLIDSETVEIELILFRDAQAVGRDIVFHKGSRIGWVACQSDVASLISLVRRLKDAGYSRQSMKFRLEWLPCGATKLTQLA